MTNSFWYRPLMWICLRKACAVGDVTMGIWQIELGEELDEKVYRSFEDVFDGTGINGSGIKVEWPEIQGLKEKGFTLDNYKKLTENSGLRLRVWKRKLIQICNWYMSKSDEYAAKCYEY